MSVELLKGFSVSALPHDIHKGLPPLPPILDTASSRGYTRGKRDSYGAHHIEQTTIINHANSYIVIHSEGANIVVTRI